MDMKLKPYDEYKETGLVWLDSVPKHWKLIKIKHLFAERTEKGYPDEPLLAATQTKGVVPKSIYENRTVIAQKDLHLLKLVRLGDFVISLRSFQGGIEYAYYQGIISPAYTVIVPNKEIREGYFRYLAKSRIFLELLRLCVTGIREGQNIDYSMLKNSEMPLPPIEEQDQIVKYIDNKLSKINKFIKTKQKQIKLLEEQKHAIINKSVTNGLNPNSKMKPSGIKWLGHIPEHWDVGHNFQIFSERNEKKYSYMNLLSVTIRNGVMLQKDMLDKNTIKRDSSNEDKSNYKRVLEGDIAYNKMRMWQGAAGCSNYNGIVSPAYIILKPVRDISSWYYHYLYRTSMYSKYSYSQSYGICDDQLSLRYDQFKRMFILIPPINEQKEIVRYINNESQKIDKVVEIIKKEIDLANEYRTTLISNVVTGKVDVRNIKIEDFIEEIEEEVEDLEEGDFEEEETQPGEE